MSRRISFVLAVVALLTVGVVLFGGDGDDENGVKTSATNKRHHFLHSSLGGSSDDDDGDDNGQGDSGSSSLTVKTALLQRYHQHHQQASVGGGGPSKSTRDLLRQQHAHRWRDTLGVLPQVLSPAQAKALQDVGDGDGIFVAWLPEAGKLQQDLPAPTGLFKDPLPVATWIKARNNPLNLTDAQFAALRKEHPPLKLFVLVMSTVDDEDARALLRHTCLATHTYSGEYYVERENKSTEAPPKQPPPGRSTMPPKTMPKHPFEMRYRFIVGVPPRDWQLGYVPTTKHRQSSFVDLPGNAHTHWTLDQLAIPPALREEHELYNDILFVPIHDAAIFTSQKYYAALHWTARYAHDADFVLRMDSDVAVHVPLLAHYLSTTHLDAVRTNSRDVVVGQVLGNQPVLRPSHVDSTRNKFRVPLADFPFANYAAFPQGGVSVLSLPLARKVAQIAYEDKCGMPIHLDTALLGTYIDLINRRSTTEATKVVKDFHKRFWAEVGLVPSSPQMKSANAKAGGPNPDKFDLNTPWLALHKVEQPVLELLFSIQYTDHQPILPCPKGYPPLDLVPWEPGSLVLGPTTSEKPAATNPTSVPESWMLLLQNLPWTEWTSVCWAFTDSATLTASRTESHQRSVVPRLLHISPQQCFVTHPSHTGDDGLINSWWLQHFANDL